MIKRITFFICLTFLGGSVFSQKTSVVDDAGIKVKMFNAHQDFLAGDYASALKKYLDANTTKPNDGSILFHLGECYNAMMDYDNAMNYLEKSEKADSNANEDLHLTLGMVYIQEDQIDNASKELNWHKKLNSNNPKKLKEDDIEHYIAECVTAKQLEAHPLKVTVTNLGDAINSTYDDKSPSVSADGATLIFTSQRQLLVGKMKQSKDPNATFDNVYIATWDTAKNGWGLSYPISGDVNEEYAHTSCTSISPDGNQIFLYKNPTSGSAIGGDIFVSKRSKKGKWGAPVSLGSPINTSYYEDGACLSPDGNTLYFVSERPGGFGRADIYKSDKISRKEWGKPENLGPRVNSDFDEGAPFIAPDGHTLFFSSDGHSSMGGYDIFKTSINDSGKWTFPVNLGYPINTVNNEKGFTLSADARTGYFASDRKGGEGKRDIYSVDLSFYPVLASDDGSAKPKGFSILRGKISNAKGDPFEDANVAVMDSAGVKIATMKSNADGQYFITLKGNSTYKLKITAKGYKGYTKPIKLPSSPIGTFTMNLDVILEKE